MVLVLFHLVHEPFCALEVSPVDCDGCVDSKIILAVVRAVMKILRVIAISGSCMYVFFRIMVRHLISPLGSSRRCPCLRCKTPTSRHLSSTAHERNRLHSNHQRTSGSLTRPIAELCIFLCQRSCLTSIRFKMLGIAVLSCNSSPWVLLSCLHQSNFALLDALRGRTCCSRFISRSFQLKSCHSA